MYSGITLVNKIDILLNELGMSRKDFAKQIEINPSTVSTWKTRNIIPPSETLFNITQYFEVSLDWLITEDVHQGIRDFQHTITLRKQIREKIYDIISKKQGIPNGENIDTHNKFFEKIPELTYRLLYNWSEGRININEFIFKDIAFLLGVDIEYLFENKTNTDISVTVNSHVFSKNKSLN